MMRVGITGGIGSGKSTACEIFAELGVPIYDCDREAKRLMNESAEADIRHNKSFFEFVKQVVVDYAER